MLHEGHLRDENSVCNSLGSKHRGHRHRKNFVSYKWCCRFAVPHIGSEYMIEMCSPFRIGTAARIWNVTLFVIWVVLFSSSFLKNCHLPFFPHFFKAQKSCVWIRISLICWVKLKTNHAQFFCNFTKSKKKVKFLKNSVLVNIFFSFTWMLQFMSKCLLALLTQLCSTKDALRKMAWHGVFVTGISWPLTKRIPQMCKISSSLKSVAGIWKKWRRTRNMVALSLSSLPVRFRSSVWPSNSKSDLYLSGSLFLRDIHLKMATASYSGNGLAEFLISILIGEPRARVSAHSAWWEAAAVQASAHIGQPHNGHLQLFEL